jgi:hypothetical protein
MEKGQLLVLLLVSGGALHLRGQTVMYDRDASGVIDRAEIVARGRLDRSSARALARQFLDRYGQSREVLSLVIGEDGPEIGASCFHRADTIPSESRRRMEELRKLEADITRVGPPKHPIARVVSISGNALLTFRDGDSVSEEVLHGADPTRFKVDGVDFELLHLVLTTGSAGVAEDVRNSLALYFRVKPKVSLSSTLAAFHRLASIVKINNLDIRVRPDAWFLEYDDYPFFPAFVPGLQPPNIGQYDLSSDVSCGSSARHGLKCSGRNFEP